MKTSSLSVSFDYTLRCPRDGNEQTVRFEANPQNRGHFLDVVSCTALTDADERKCAQSCRLAFAAHEYWLRPCLNAIIYSDQ